MAYSSVISERLNLLLNCGLYRTRRALAQAAGVNEVTLSDNLKHTEPRFSTLEGILFATPELSAEWLMRGKGEMFLNQPTVSGDNIINIDRSQRIVRNGGTISDNSKVEAANDGAKDIVIERLKQENELLKEQISKKDALLERMLTLMEEK